MTPGIREKEWDRGRWKLRAHLILNAEGNINEVKPGAISAGWVRINGHFPLSACIEGTFQATVTVYLSNADDPAADGAVTDYPFAGTPVVNGPQSLEIDRPYEWAKAVVSDWQSGVIRRVSLFGAGYQD